MSPNPPPPLPTLPDSVTRVAARTVGVTTRRQAGAGLQWRPGVIVTTASLLWRQSSASLVLPDGEQVVAELRGLDAATDLAVLSWADPAVAAGAAGSAAGEAPGAAAGGAALPAADRGAADNGAALLRTPTEPRVGDFVFAVGREPSGLVQASFGHIGLVGGAWRSWRGGSVDGLWRLDGGLYPGLDGAPVADAEGRLLGIASSAFARHHGVVLPAATVDRVLDQLLTHGRVARGYLGLSGQPVRATLDGQPVDGLLVSSVAEDGPAAQGGLLVGDVIVTLDGVPTASLDALRDRLVVGAAVAARVARGGQGLNLTLTVAERPRRGCH